MPAPSGREARTGSTPSPTAASDRVLALQRTAGNAAVSRLLAGQPALLQRSFVYSHVHSAIGGSHEPDAYYERLHFQRVQSADGHWVWADPRNVGIVATLNVPPLVLKRYPPTAAPAAHDGDGSAPQEAAVLAPQLHAVAAQLEQVAERLEPVLLPAEAALGPAKPAAAAVAPKPKTRRVHMAALQAPTHDNDWQQSVPLDRRLALLKRAAGIALNRWEHVGPDALCVLAAPEYLFAAQAKESHFMAAEAARDVTAQLEEFAKTLPSNVLFVPGTIGWSEVVGKLPAAAEAKGKEGKEKGGEPGDPAKEKLEGVVRELEAAHQACRKLAGEAVAGEKSGLGKEWRFEAGQIKEKAPGDVRLVFNEALVFFNRSVMRYRKMFESVEGTTDRRGGDMGTLFMHGDRPFSEVFMDVRVSLEICSDFASDAAKIAAEQRGRNPALQLVVASDYRGAEGGRAGQHLLLADSTGATSQSGEDDVEQATIDLGPRTKLHFSTNELPTE